MGPNAVLTTDNTFSAPNITESNIDGSIGLLLQSSTASSLNSTDLVFKDNQSTPQTITVRKQGTDLAVLDNSGNKSIGFDTSSSSILFGSSFDTSLFRSTTNTLATNGSLSVAGTLTNSGTTLINTNSLRFKIRQAQLY